ncbi:MAG: hypothetical protein H7A26_07390 [Spirochaetales bacterium]|nr:hypothetical protein [Spirochaetales bacterium]
MKMDIKEIFGRFSVRKNIIKIAAFTLIFIIVLLLASLVFNLVAERNYRNSSAAAEVSEDPDLPEISIDAGDLKIPEAYTATPEFTWKPYRTPSDKWSEEEIRRFWKDPADVIIEAYADENRKHIESILEDVR